MATRIGRPPFGSKIVDTLEASDHARARLGAILRSVEGAPIAPLCEELGMKRAYFHRMRTDALQAAAESLEPKTSGPKPQLPDPRDARIAELEAQLASLSLALDATRIRAELGIALPSVLRKLR